MTARARESLVAGLRPLLAAEAAAEALATHGDPADLEQAVWLRFFEHLAADRAPADAAAWVRRAVRAEARAWRRTARHESPHASELFDRHQRTPEQHAVSGAQERRILDAVRRLPGRCPRVVSALLSPRDRTYREIAGELGISQGSLGPQRSRCLGCLRRMLAAEVAAPEPRGMEWGTTC